MHISSSRMTGGKISTAQVSHNGLTSHHHFGQTLRTKATVGIPKEKLLLRCAQPRSIPRPNVCSTPSIGNLGNFRSSDTTVTQDGTKIHDPTDLSDDSFRGRSENELRTLPVFWWSFNLASFRAAR